MWKSVLDIYQDDPEGYSGRVMEAEKDGEGSRATPQDRNGSP